MSRELASHKVNGLNNEIVITALDEPGSGGANHRYKVCVPMINPVEAHPALNSKLARTYTDINFQDGPIQSTEDINGITNEALLAVVEDRLKGFQSGQFACRENAIALTHIQDALHWLHHRTRERVARGVEGTLAK